MSHDITFKYNKKEKTYWASMSHNGKSAMIAFFDMGPMCHGSRQQPEIYHEFDVGFGVGTSRKQVMDWLFNRSDYLCRKISGNGDVHYLYFARDALRAFEQLIRVHLPPDRYVINVEGADKRRFRVYRKYLEAHLGYKCEFDSQLLKVIDTRSAR